MDTKGVFDFEIDLSGGRVVVTRKPLCPGCLSDGEVDYQIQRLKDNLDSVSNRMKSAIRSQAKQPLNLGK